MKIGTIVLGVYLIMAGLSGLGLAIPVILIAVAALAAGILILIGR